MMRFFDWTQCFIPGPSKYAAGEFYRNKGESRLRVKEAEVRYKDDSSLELIEKEEFVILGKRYRCDGDTDTLRKSFLHKLTAQLQRIDDLNVSPGTKLAVYQKGFSAFNRW